MEQRNYLDLDLKKGALDIIGDTTNIFGVMDHDYANYYSDTIKEVFYNQYELSTLEKEKFYIGFEIWYLGLQYFDINDKIKGQGLLYHLNELFLYFKILNQTINDVDVSWKPIFRAFELIVSFKNDTKEITNVNFDNAIIWTIVAHYFELVSLEEFQLELHIRIYCKLLLMLKR